MEGGGSAGKRCPVVVASGSARVGWPGEKEREWIARALTDGEGATIVRARSWTKSKRPSIHEQPKRGVDLKVEVFIFVPLLWVLKLFGFTCNFTLTNWSQKAGVLVPGFTPYNCGVVGVGNELRSGFFWINGDAV
uniref:Uncharacterized protein n=1 Tax=Oryza brachyantha TaxID=4533 RepID=J3LTV4_ORYBR